MQSAYQLMIINVCNVLLNELWHCTHTIATTATNTRYARLGANEQAADCPRSVQFPVGFHLADIATLNGPQTIPMRHLARILGLKFWYLRFYTGVVIVVLNAIKFKLVNFCTFIFANACFGISYTDTSNRLLFRRSKFSHSDLIDQASFLRIMYWWSDIQGT